MSITALLACTSFYSALYLFYFYFAKQQQPLLLILAVVLLIFAYIITPSAEKKERRHFNNTLSYENWFTLPLYTWWRLFSLPIRFLLSKLFD